MKTKKVFNVVLNVLLIIFAVLSISVSGILIFQKKYFDPFWVNGQSMYPTLNAETCDKNGVKYGVNGGNLSKDDNYFVDYGIMDTHENALKKLKRFDIVVWNTLASSGGDNNLIKRIVGLPGETIKFSTYGDLAVKDSDGKFSVIDQPIDSNYLNGSYPTHEITLGSDEYYLCGDNRAHSHDCRSMNRSAKRNEIVGKVIAIVGHCEVHKVNGKFEISNIDYTFWPRFIK